MLIRLNGDAALWFNRSLQPMRMRKQPAGFIRKVWDSWSFERFELDLSDMLDESSFLKRLAAFVARIGKDTVYEREFDDVSRKITAMIGTSVIERLASIVDPPEPFEAGGFTRRKERSRAAAKIAARYERERRKGEEE